MIPLRATTDWRLDRAPFVARITSSTSSPHGDGVAEALLVESNIELEGLDVEGYQAVLVRNGTVSKGYIVLPPQLAYLQDEDVVRIDPRSGQIRVLYRRNSPHNHFLVTERCNSRCLMCSQPPRDINDGYLVEELLQTIPLISPATEMIGFTGGEITLLGQGFIDLLVSARDYLSNTHVFCLTNGRLLKHLRYAERIADVNHPSLILCIPLYSDVDSIHDFVVQAKGAFDETVRGIMNLGRVGVPIEIRVVIHQQTYKRLPQLAEFITRNLPFVSHVALMGLEMTGFTNANIAALWVDPFDYQTELLKAVETLQWAKIDVSIYNHQLCLVPKSIWSVCKKSISDWKNEYMSECEGCMMKGSCGGFFASSSVRHSNNITKISS